MPVPYSCNAKTISGQEVWRQSLAAVPCLQAFEKNPKDADTLANLVVVSLHLGKNSSRYLG